MASPALSVVPRSRTLHILGNGLLFNISWLVIVLSESNAVALMALCAHLALHFLWLGRDFREMSLIALVATGGFALDQGLFSTGVFTLQGQAAGAPLWLSCLWPVFATTLCHAFAGLQGKPLIAAALGAVSGTASYIAGVRLTSVDFGDAVLSPLVLVILWALLFPALLWLASRVVGDERA